MSKDQFWTIGQWCPKVRSDRPLGVGYTGRQATGGGGYPIVPGSKSSTLSVPNTPKTCRQPRGLANTQAPTQCPHSFVRWQVGTRGHQLGRKVSDMVKRVVSRAGACPAPFEEILWGGTSGAERWCWGCLRLDGPLGLQAALSQIQGVVANVVPAEGPGQDSSDEDNDAQGRGCGPRKGAPQWQR